MLYNKMIVGNWIINFENVKVLKDIEFHEQNHEISEIIVMGIDLMKNRGDYYIDLIKNELIEIDNNYEYSYINNKYDIYVNFKLRIIKIRTI